MKNEKLKIKNENQKLRMVNIYGAPSKGPRGKLERGARPVRNAERGPR
jgi:hypothetical protein